MPIIINNSNVNYTLYYSVLDYFKTIMCNHPSISHVTQGDVFDIDTNEFPNYPIGNIIILNARFEENTTIYNCQLTVADKIKDKNNESTGVYNRQTLPYYGTDDTVDIHANTLAIINDLLSFTEYRTTNFDILEPIMNVPFKDAFNNGLAGWVSTFDLLTHNPRPKCVFDNLLAPCEP